MNRHEGEWSDGKEYGYGTNYYHGGLSIFEQVAEGLTLSPGCW